LGESRAGKANSTAQQHSGDPFMCDHLWTPSICGHEHVAQPAVLVVSKRMDADFFSLLFSKRTK
jgi:hypothetical protein